MIRQTNQTETAPINSTGLQQNLQAADTELRTEAVLEAQHPAFLEASVEPLLGQFKQATLRYKQQVRLALRWGIGSAFVFLGIEIVVLLIALQTGEYPFGATVGMWGVYALILAAGIALPWSSANTRRTSAAALAHFDDVRVIGPLAEILETADRPTRQLVSDALIRLLPRLQSSDAHLLNEDQRECLCRILSGADWQHPELAVAVMEAFQRVGDSRALILIERLADIHARSSAQRQIRAAAASCLPALRARVVQEPARLTLLRPSSGNSGADTLLRAAESTVPSETDVQQLLRPDTAPPSA